MPKDNHEKTASAHSSRLFLFGVALLFFAIIANPFSRNVLTCSTYRMPSNGTITIGAGKFKTEIVDNESSREKGLSGRPCIKGDRAMLFKFDNNDMTNHCFWMKDMRFAIDMVWLDANKRVVYIVNNAQPASYPNSFCPGVPTRYTVELKSGQTAKVRIAIGDKVNI